MKRDSCVVQRLLQHGLEVIFPNEEEMARLHEIIMKELSFNIINEESKQVYLRVIQLMNDEQNIEGIVLGCTGENFKFNRLRLIMYLSCIILEIPLLVKQPDIPHIPVFDSTQLHVRIRRFLFIFNLVLYYHLGTISSGLPT